LEVRSRPITLWSLNGLTTPMPTRNLRQDTIKPLPYLGARNEQCFDWDQQLIGFGVRVYPTGRKTFVCSYRVQGRRRIATLGRADILKLDTARKKAVAYLGQVAEGLDPQAPKDTLKAAGTMKSLVDAYIGRHAKLKKGTWADDEAYLARHLLPQFGSRLALAITTDDMAALHSEIGSKHPYAANRLLEIVRKMYNLGRKWGLVPIDKANPASGVERFPETKRRRFVTPDELPQLSKAIEQEFDEYVRHAIWLLLLTGLRRGELLNAKWSDIDWKQRTLSIPKTKNGEALLAPLSHAAVARLKLVPRMQDNPYIICGRKAGQALVNLNDAWNRIRTTAGLQDLRIHDLRRTVGSWLVRDGASLHLVGSVLNHKDQKTTAGYAYFQTKERHKALDKHGRNVIDFASRLPAASTSALEQSPAPSINLPPCRWQIHTFTREALYKLVWSEPTRTLSKRFGISDVGLAKVCRRANIPTPDRGYWARVTAGQECEKTHLPPLETAATKIVRFRGRGRSESNWGR
jgi:integrase